MLPCVYINIPYQHTVNGGAQERPLQSQLLGPVGLHIGDNSIVQCPLLKLVAARRIFKKNPRPRQSGGPAADYFKVEPIY